MFPTQITANEVERTRYDAMDDMLATTTSAFLGLTIGCARCHDHKFDPIPNKDYYEMLSTFTTTVRSNVELVVDPERVKALQAAHAAALQPLEQAQMDYEQTKLRADFAKILTSGQSPLPPATCLAAPIETISSQGHATFTNLDDGSWLASGENPAADVYTLTTSTTMKFITGLKLEALAHSSFPGNGPGRANNGNFALSKILISAASLAGGDSKEVVISKAEATHQQNADSLSVAASLDDNPVTGWAVDGGGIGKDQAAVFHFAEPLAERGGVKFTITLAFAVNTAHCIGRPRLSLFVKGPPGLKAEALPEAVTVAAKKVSHKESLTTAQQIALFDWWKQGDAKWQELHQAVTDHTAKAPKPTTPVMVCAEGYEPIVMHSQGPPFLPTTHYLKRGDTNQKQGEASQGFLQVLNRSGNIAAWKWDPPVGSKCAGKRRSFANWLTDSQNGAGSLMARVTANRLWQHHFGRGIVATVNDLGHSGALPTHPELLDWLASEFIRNEWKLKPLHRLLMTSAAYQQSSVTDAQKTAADPENLSFLRRIPTRLEGEAVRDSVLAVAGMLDVSMFGTGTLDENSVRRSIYFTVKRSQLVNSMVVFDSPEPLTSQGSRPITTVAPQALLLMNSPQVRTWAAAFAKRLLREAPLAGPTEFTPLIQRAYSLALSREPRPSELAAAQVFLEHGLPAGAQKTVTDFCQTLFALNEFSYSN